MPAGRPRRTSCGCSTATGSTARGRNERVPVFVVVTGRHTLMDRRAAGTP
jgi:hypothetical protein